MKGLNRILQNAAVSVTVAEKGRAPSQVATFGIDLAKGPSGPFDEVWCVVDVDDFGACGDLAKAVGIAEKASGEDLTVRMAVSNPCFELWLILHFADQRAHIASYAQMKPLLRKTLPTYTKSGLDFARDGYAAAYGDAARRAESLEPTGLDFTMNPSTNMWLLVRAIGG